MKSRVTELYDYTKAEVPAELRLWRVTDKAMEEHLAVLSRSHALELDVDEVQPGDSVVCRGESAVGRWNKPVLLFYPCRNLCEKVIEEALVGMKVGEHKTICASEGDVTLTVSRIVRREPHPIDDELVKLEHVGGVENLKSYCRWYRKTTEAEDRKRNLSYLARFLIEEIAKNSVCEIDKDEENAWAEEISVLMRKAGEANGIDPTLPEEGTDFLTEEQVREKYLEKSRPFFRAMVVYAGVAQALSGQDAETIFLAGLKEMAAKSNLDAETMLEKFQISDAAARNQVFFNKAEEMLKERCEQLMEE